MTKAKTNALDALRTLIAERQQYEQWVAALDAKKESTAEHVFERVKADYQSRLERVVSDIRGHSEELQLSISTLSSRLVEVAREEDTRREGLQEAELRAAVGEYEPEQWEQLRSEAEKALEKIATDRASLDSQLGELRAIQKLSEVGGAATAAETASPSTPQVQEPPVASPAQAPAPEVAAAIPPAQAAAPTPSAPPEPVQPKPPAAEPVAAAQPPAPPPPAQSPQPAPPADSAPRPPQDQGRLPLEPVAAAARAAAASSAPGRSMRTPASGNSVMRSKSEVVKPDNSKTLKCPECGTPNYPTEWYCERCGGELATM